MNTNSIPIITTIAQQHGFNLTGPEVTLILAAGGAAIRWIRFELAAIEAAGGLRSIWAKLIGPKQPKV